MQSTTATLLDTALNQRLSTVDPRLSTIGRSQLYSNRRLSPIRVIMSAYPEFDANWRTKDASARKAESILRGLVAGPKAPSLTAIRFAIEALAKELPGCRKLFEQINAHYKRSKKECAELQAQAAKAEKCTEEKHHAITNAKEYRARVQVLEKKVTELVVQCQK
jgi:hypothetical protein